MNVEDRRTISERFADFDREHPQVYAQFVAFARRIKARGFKHYSADMLMSAIRFHTDLGSDGREPWKINNTYTSRYARKLANEYPDEFGEFFEFRMLKSA